MLEKITLTPPFTAAECTFWQNVFGGIAAAYPAGAVVNPGTATAGTPVTSSTSSAPAAVNYFPADPTQAPAPSPENSEILILNGTINGPAYLKDASASIYQLTLTGAAAIGPSGGIVVINGVPRPNTNNNYTSLIVRQGQVWLIATGGQIQYFSPAQGSLESGPATLPTPWPNGVAPTAAQTAATAAASEAANLVPPVPNAVAPGSSGKTILCGGTLTLPTIASGIAAAVDGDTVLVQPGTYAEALGKVETAIYLGVVGGAATIDANGTIAPSVTLNVSSFASAQLAGGGLGALSFTKDAVVEGFCVTGAGIHDTAAQLCSGFRTEGGYLTLKSCLATGNQVGLGQGGANCVVTVEGSRFEANGIDDESHNIYVGGGGQGTLVIANSWSVNPLTAHALKTRFPKTVATGCVFESPNGSCVDFPNGAGAVSTFTDCTFIKVADAADHQIFTDGEEGDTDGDQDISIAGGTIDAACANPLISVSAGTITLTGVTFLGNPITAPSGNVVGLPA